MPKDPAVSASAEDGVFAYVQAYVALSKLHTGIQWEHLPQELGFRSGMTCRRRLRD